ncbi:MAG: pro-sigmaK processing inhibitor BofA family protein [Bacilli bacterium]
MKIIKKIIKIFITGVFLLYGYNLIATPLGLIIPINLVTITLVGVIGFPILVGLVIFLVLSF